MDKHTAAVDNILALTVSFDTASSARVTSNLHVISFVQQSLLLMLQKLVNRHMSTKRIHNSVRLITHRWC